MVQCWILGDLNLNPSHNWWDPNLSCVRLAAWGEGQVLSSDAWLLVELDWCNAGGDIYDSRKVRTADSTVHTS